VLISYTFEPVFFSWLVSKKGRKRVSPVTLGDLVATLIVFGIFVGGSILLNVMLLAVILLPVTWWQKKRIMHYFMCVFSKIPVYTMVHIRKRVVNLAGEDFRKPALILSNHQSHIDLLLLLMLNPRIIVITTKWVWNNPIYALVIRFLQFYPVMEGYGVITEKLRSSVARGYSILVFPEGSRSPDGRINRFHKGAFVMAERLGLDLLPVIIHGASDCMNKGENHLKGGTVTLKIYPRVKPGDAGYGTDYHQQTKLMLSFYRKEYKRMREELETPDYFRRKLIRNYIYKGPVLEWYTRIKLSLENNYNLINSLIPRKARVVDIGCGYGYMAYMLGFVSEERQILGIDYDEDKIELAENCISKNDRISFVAADATAYPYEMSDVFLLSDVLHYIPYEKQAALLIACISHLNPGGIIIVRDADQDLGKRHRGTRLTEFFSTRSGFNRAENARLYFFSGKTMRDIAGKHNMDIEIIDNSNLTSNVFFVLRRPPVNIPDPQVTA
jgi:1-acyl-sn-glycerol-3-phosphate acyltransferase